eukprot:Ihof_evm1s304 gene=Ihof_evmTU1s304
MDKSLRASLKPLVLFVGLHDEYPAANPNGNPPACVIKNPSIRNVVWQSFLSNSESGKTPLTYKSVPVNHRFRPKKERNSNYKPRGLIKSNWMYKHLHVLPAVVVVYFELEWDDQRWDNVQAGCANTLAGIRAGLQGRETRLVVVLIQQHATPKDESQTEARAIIFRRTCEVEGKNSLFILPMNDNKDLNVYVRRLESVFRDLAVQYTEDCQRRIKNHRLDATGLPAQILVVRHQFKLGFLAEMAENHSDALLHYNMAYNSIFNVQNSGERSYEVKSMAGMINFR